MKALQRLELLAYLLVVVYAYLLVHRLALDDLAYRRDVADLEELLQEIAIKET